MDYDSFLERATKDVARKDDVERYTTELQNRLWHVIELYDPKRVIDKDPDREEQFKREAIDRYIVLMHEYAQQHPTEYPDDPETIDEIVWLHANTQVALEQVDQHALIRDMQFLVVEYETKLETGQTPDPGATTDAKKSLTASLIIDNKMHPDDPWIDVLNDIVPGENFQPDDPEDEKYLIGALEELANLEQKQRKITEVLDQGGLIAGLTEFSTAQERTAVYQILSQGSALQVNFYENAEAQRRSELTEIGLRGGLSPSVIQALISFIEEKYPIDPMA